MSNLISVSDKNAFEKMLQAYPLLLVDFWAEWCGPCRSLGSILEDFAQEMGSKITITKINVDEVPDLAEKYDIQSIPALFLIKNGEIVAQRSGGCGKEGLKSFIEPYLKGLVP